MLPRMSNGPTIATPRRPAVFLDRDGTLIEDVGPISSPDALRWLPDTFEALRRLAAHYELFIVTHQVWISRGVLTTEDVERVHRALLDRLAAEGVPIRRIYTCPHTKEEGCLCRKPSPHHLFEAAREFHLDLARSFVVGDHPHDVETAVRAGSRGLYVRTGHGERHFDELPAGTFVVPGIREAADWILAIAQAERRMGDWTAELARAVARLRAGRIGVFPTETVYGLGARALDPLAIARVFEAKQRPAFDPLIVHVAGEADATMLAAEWPEAAHRLARAFWPGPLTIVVSKRPEVPDIVTAGRPTVALRCPRHPVAIELLRALGEPIAAPSANLFGRTSPTHAEHLDEAIRAAADFVLDAGPCAVGVESTIVALRGGRPVLLRPGGVPLEAIEALVGPLEVPAESSCDHPESPGRLPRHYAPRTRLALLNSRAAAAPPEGRWGCLAFREPPAGGGWAMVEVLSPAGDLREAAANLFAALRRLDDGGLDGIAAEPAPEVGLGRAINDRLRRAAHPEPAA